jgi:hypothetical protein
MEVNINSNNRLSLLRLILERFWLDRLFCVGRELDADKVMMGGDGLNVELPYLEGEICDLMDVDFENRWKHQTGVFRTVL